MRLDLVGVVAEGLEGTASECGCETVHHSLAVGSRAMSSTASAAMSVDDLVISRVVPVGRSE